MEEMAKIEKQRTANFKKKAGVSFYNDTTEGD